MDIEKLATSTVTISISATDYLSSFINEGDKEPSWDGTIYVDNDKSKKKETIKGRVSVQVKGHVTNDLSKEQTSYQVDKADLRNYLNDGGVVFFVVYIPTDNQMPKIYYSSLLPVKLRMLLAQCKGSKAIQLQEFPKDNVQKVNLFVNFLENSHKQASFANAELLSLDDYEKHGILEGISMTVAGYNIDRTDLQRALFDNEVYMYASVKGSSIPQPLDFIPMDIHTSQEVNSPITAGGRLFYTQYMRIRSKENTTVRIGQSTKLVLPAEHSGTWKINYKTSPRLCDGTHDLDFFISALDSKQFEIGGLVYPLSPNKMEMSNFDIHNQREVLASSKRILEMFRILGLNPNIDMTKLPPDDRLNIDHLIKALLNNEPISGLNPDLPLVVRMELTAGKIALVFQHCDNPNTYTISDFFKTPIMMCVDVDGKKQPVSQYALLRKEDFLELSNLDLSVLLSSYQEIDGNQHLYERANFTLLELLTAYDVDENRKELLNSAKGFAEWLCSVGSDSTSLPHEVTELNRLQVVKRERALNKDEIKYLCSLVEEANQREDIKVGAYLLLDNQAAAEIHFEQVPQDYQNEFMTYPIFKFWVKTNENTPIEAKVED